MKTVFDTEAVQVLCNCKRFLPLCRTYFCRYCFDLRCGSCITHEVDGYYCPSCLETIASGEANTRKDKCSNCFVCPSCGNMLSTRATVTQTQKPNDTGALKYELQKLFYMACSYCRWTTRESNIPDKSNSVINFPEYFNSNNKIIKDLVESFNRFATKEKHEKERTKYASRKNYFFLMESSSSSRRRYSTQMRMSSKRKSVDLKPIELPTAEPLLEINDISDSCFTGSFNLEKQTNITQRLRDPERQPTNVKDLRPISMQILVKRSERCRKCDHNLCKPEIATSSIKFKINLGSIYHVPELRITPLPSNECFSFNKPQKMVLTIINPAHRITTVKLGPIMDFIDEISTAKLKLPQSDLKVGAKNEIMGFDEIDQASNEFDADDDPKIIVGRKHNRLEFNVIVTPMKSRGRVIACVTMTFDYKDATLFYATAMTDNKNQNDISLRSVTYKLVFGSIALAPKSDDT